MKMRNYVTFNNLELDTIEHSKKYGGLEMSVEKRPHKKKKTFDELARDSVIEGTKLRFKIETFYNLFVQIN